MLSRMRFEASFAFDALETKVKASAYPFLTCASLLGRVYAKHRGRLFTR